MATVKYLALTGTATLIMILVDTASTNWGTTAYQGDIPTSVQIVSKSWPQLGMKLDYFLEITTPILLVTVILSILVAFTLDVISDFFKTAYAILIGGVLSNMAEKWIWGYVLDYITIGSRVWSLGDLTMLIGFTLVLLGPKLKKRPN